MPDDSSTPLTPISDPGMRAEARHTASEYGFEPLREVAARIQAAVNLIDADQAPVYVRRQLDWALAYLDVELGRP